MKWHEQRRNRRKLNEGFLRKLKPQQRSFLIWDQYQRGLAVRVEPTGSKSWMCIYNFQRRSRWYRIGNADAIDLAGARKLASKIMFKVADGQDPQAERVTSATKPIFPKVLAMDGPHEPGQCPTDLYRWFDANSTLLYVGISNSAAIRASGHRKGSAWYSTSVGMTRESFPTREAAKIAERIAIETEHPIHNIAHNNRKKTRHA